MAKYGEYQEPGGDFERAENGEYVVVLKEIEETTRPNFNDASITDDVWRWKFETVEARDSEDRPFLFMTTTKTRYGNEKAALTILIDGMFRTHFDKYDWQRVDVDKLVGKKFKALVALETNPETKKEYNKILSVSRPKNNPIKLEDVIGDEMRNRAAAAPSDRDDVPPARVAVAAGNHGDIDELDDPFADGS